MFFQRYINIHIIFLRSFRKVNQLMLSFIEFRIMFFCSFDDFVLYFFNVSQFRFINLLYINMLMSFTNSIILKRNLTFLHDFNRFTL